MRTLIIGASGFIGRAVVPELLSRGHDVRALVRPACATEHLGWGSDVEIVEGDLRAPAGLRDAVAGADAVIHLGMPVTADGHQQFVVAATGTENLADAITRSCVRRLVLASSLVVYNWSYATRTVTEDTELAANPYSRDAYTIAKIWQERVARRKASRNGFELTVMRPGIVWGPGREWISGLGQRAGGLYLIVGPSRLLPLTYVTNCATAFADALEHPGASGKTFNVVDGADVTAWSYARCYVPRFEPAMRLIPVPRRIIRSGLSSARTVADGVLGGGSRLPGVFTQQTFDARFPVTRVSGDRIRFELDWRPHLSFAEAARMTFG